MSQKNVLISFHVSLAHVVGLFIGHNTLRKMGWRGKEHIFLCIVTILCKRVGYNSIGNNAYFMEIISL